MAVLKIMTKPITKRSHKHVPSSSSIKSLPKDLLLELLAKVASSSFTDLYNLKITSRDFLDVSEDNYVYRHVSLTKFPAVPWFTTDKEIAFLGRCKESGNSESFYREGMMEYFDHANVKSGLENLRKAAETDHKEAKYVYGMILLCSADEHLRKEGLRYLRFLRIFKCVRRCRKNVRDFIWSMWVRNGVVRKGDHLCSCKTKCGGLKRRWLCLEDEDDEDSGCENCRWDYEISLFCRLFKASMVLSVF